MCQLLIPNQWFDIYKCIGTKKKPTKNIEIIAFNRKGIAYNCKYVYLHANKKIAIKRKRPCL